MLRRDLSKSLQNPTATCSTFTEIAYDVINLEVEDFRSPKTYVTEKIVSEYGWSDSARLCFSQKIVVATNHVYRLISTEQSVIISWIYRSVR